VRRAAIALVLLALAGCGASHPTDAQIAHRAGLTLRDLPSGWTRAGAGRHADCPAFHQARRDASAWTDSGRLVRDGGRSQVAGTIFVFRRPARARRTFANLSSPATRSCYASRLGTALRLRGVTDFVTRVDPLGDEQAGARFVVSYTSGVLYIDLLIVRAGRGIATELYTGNGAPLDGGLRYDLTALTARRLAANLRG
jgi:hypothetical protein